MPSASPLSPLTDEEKRLNDEAQKSILSQNDWRWYPWLYLDKDNILIPTLGIPYDLPSWAPAWNVTYNVPESPLPSMLGQGGGSQVNTPGESPQQPGMTCPPFTDAQWAILHFMVSGNGAGMMCMCSWAHETGTATTDLKNLRNRMEGGKSWDMEWTNADSIGNRGCETFGGKISFEHYVYHNPGVLQGCDIDAVRAKITMKDGSVRTVSGGAYYDGPLGQGRQGVCFTYQTFAQIMNALLGTVRQQVNDDCCR